MKKYKFTNNLGLKIMALVFAALLWLIVVNIDDPVESTTFRNIDVTVQNTEVVTNEGKTYKILDDTQKVSVVVRAKRSVLAKLSSSSIIATADMSEMQISSLIPITATVPGYEGQYTAEATPGNLKVKIEDQTKNPFPVNVSVTGIPRDGYVVGNTPTNPAKVTVSGAESLVNSIDKAVAKVDVSGLSKTTVLQAELTYYDSNGNPVDKSQLKDNLGEDGITVEVEILNTKSVALNFNVMGTPEEGYVYSGLTSEPERIQVCGTAEALSGFTELDVPASEIDISGATEKLEQTIDIVPYLPEGIKLVDETANNVVVTVSIEQEGTRTIELLAESIRVNNVQDNLRVSFEDNTDIQLQFKGAQEALEKLDVKNAVYIDLKTYTKPGSYEVPVNVDLDMDGANGSNITLLKNPTVKVTLTEKDEKEEQSVTKEE